MTDNQTQVFRIYINAPAQKGWDALTTPELYQRYGYGGPVDVDLTPGGHYRNLSTEVPPGAQRHQLQGEPGLSI